MTPTLKKANVSTLVLQEMSNSTHGFIIDSQLEIHYDDDQRIRISGCAMGCGSGQYFYHIIVIPINLQVLIRVTNEKYYDHDS